MDKKDLLFRLIKIADIGYITSIYFAIGILLAKQCDMLFNRIFGEYNTEKEDKKSKLRRALELIFMIWTTGTIIYIIRNLVELIPSPFDAIMGFEHLRVKELKNAGIFTFVFIMFQSHLKNKLNYYYMNIYPDKSVNTALQNTASSHLIYLDDM